MSAPPEIALLRALDRPSRDGRGNRLLLYHVAGHPALLKLYRPRSDALREWVKAAGYRVLEGKRGSTARERCAVEREQLALWRGEGFDVPALLPHPLPPEYSEDTASWLEYCPGPTLHRYVRKRVTPLEAREQAVRTFAASLAQRQARALETGELGLVMKHASLQHVLLCTGRQVHFDLESAHAPGIDLFEALADELGGLVRSLLFRVRDDEQERLGAAFLAGHGAPALLREVAARGAGGSLRRRVRRLADRARRPELGKHAALAWVAERTR
jgi:hypothetical protein